MIFMDLAGFGGSSGECFLVESTRHLARRRSRVADDWFCEGSQVVALFLREERSFGVSNCQFTDGYQVHKQGRDRVLGKSFCRACVANAQSLFVIV